MSLLQPNKLTFDGTYFLLDDPECRVKLVRHARARRYTLRLDHGGDGAILTVPPKLPHGECEEFLHRQRGWLRKALAKQPHRVVVAAGEVIPVAGEPTSIVVTGGSRSAPRLVDGVLELPGAGPAGPRIAAWLKVRARDSIQPAARSYARRVGKRIAQIQLRDTRSRWGSCSSSGTLCFSWRLAMAPPDVLDYVAAHEAAHLVEMNHSPSFWAVVDRLMPDWKARRDWLKREGRKLQSYDFSGG